MAGFAIFYEAENESRQHIDVGNVNKTTLTNLKKYTEYRLSVAVRNTIYTGPASGVMKNKTLEDGKMSWNFIITFKGQSKKNEKV